ncbi:MAG: alpha/beta hydrolase [Alphaproteobacteria bacterium]|nr:alpha/beta hydrolase [Alphaproteobacteria bacterium]
MLLHGLFSDAHVNWIKFGHARRIADRGFRVIMPDQRAHGHSDKPHQPRFYPPEVLVRDGHELVAHLGLEDFDLGGYSLGARTVVRMVVTGAAPRRLIIAGMGLEGLLDTGARAAHFKRILEGLGSFPQGSPEWMAEQFLRTTGGDPKALLPLLGSFIDTSEAEIAAIAQPTLVLSGAEDRDNGSSEALAALLPNADHVEVPGNHMNVVTKPDFGIAMADFLAPV